MADGYTKALAQLERGEITYEQYRQKLNELDTITERMEFFLAVAEHHKRAARERGYLVGDINQTDAWFRD